MYLISLPTPPPPGGTHTQRNTPLLAAYLPDRITSEMAYVTPEGLCRRCMVRCSRVSSGAQCVHAASREASMVAHLLLATQLLNTVLMPLWTLRSCSSNPVRCAATHLWHAALQLCSQKREGCDHALTCHHAQIKP